MSWTKLSRPKLQLCSVQVQNNNPTLLTSCYNIDSLNNAVTMTEQTLLTINFTASLFTLSNCLNISEHECRMRLAHCLSPLSHRIEIDQKSDSRKNVSPFRQCACPKYAINGWVTTWNLSRVDCWLSNVELMWVELLISPVLSGLFSGFPPSIQSTPRSS